MAAVVRIKRRFEDEPLEALILNCKKQKLNTSDENVSSSQSALSSTVLTLAGTINEVSSIVEKLKIIKKINYRFLE